MIWNMITTVTDLVEKLGGTSRVAEMVGVNAPAVSNAKSRNHIPHSWRMRMFQEVQKTGIEVEPSLIGLDASQ